MKSTLIKSIFIVLCFFLFSSPANATSIGLSIDPSLLKVQIKPGKSITKVFNLENTENYDKNIIVRIIPFNKTDISGNPIVDLKTSAPWLSYFGLSNANIKLNSPFILKAKTKEQIILSMAIPENANLEDIYATLLFSTYDNSLSNEQKGTLVSASIGTNILISITSSLNPPTLLKIVKIMPETGSFLKIGDQYIADSLTPITFSATVVNDGKFITDTKGLFKILKKSEPVYMQGILPQYVIAKASRELINLDGKPFSFTPTLNTFGLYKISLEIRTDNANTSNSIDIIFLPFKACFALLISLIIIKIIFSLTKKND